MPSDCTVGPLQSGLHCVFSHVKPLGAEHVQFKGEVNCVGKN